MSLQGVRRLLSARLPLWLLAAVMLPAAWAKKPATLPDHWVSTWASAQVANPNQTGLGHREVTLREIVHVSLGGPLVRVTLSNELGREPLAVASVHLALAAAGSDIQLSSANALTFNGAASIVIPPGAVALSDPAALTVPMGASLAISLTLPVQPLTMLTMHTDAHQVSYMAAGDAVGARTLPGPSAVESWFFLKSVEVKTPGGTGVVAAFGDSITDGSGSTTGANARWPDVLARRFAANKTTKHLAVIDEGIGGNRILHDGAGQSALARFDRDMLVQPGVRAVIVLEGINDIGVAFGPQYRADPVTAAQLIQGLVQLVERAHAHGIPIYLATITPYVGASYASAEGEAVRKEVNGWIRASKQIDGVIDFDDAIRDRHDPDRMAAAYDSGDHLHPSDAGYKAMGEAVSLKLFAAKP